RSRSVAISVHQREPDLIAHRVVAPDLADANLVVFAQAACDIDHAGRYIQVEGCAQPAVVGPLPHTFELVDRLTRPHLDHSLQPAAALLGQQHKIRIDRGLPGRDGRVLLHARIDARFVLTTPLALQQPDDAVVLELLADGPHKNRAHHAPPNGWIN